MPRDAQMKGYRILSKAHPWRTIDTDNGKCYSLKGRINQRRKGGEGNWSSAYGSPEAKQKDGRGFWRVSLET